MIKFSWIQTLKNGRKAPTRKSHRWKAKRLKFQLQKPLPRFFQAHGYSITRELLKESSPSSRQDIVRGDLPEDIPEPMHQLSHGAQSGLYLSSPLPKNGISSVWTSTMLLSKLNSRIQYGYIFPEDINPSQSHLHVSDSRKASMVSPSHPSYGINIYEKD